MSDNTNPAMQELENLLVKAEGILHLNHPVTPAQVAAAAHEAPVAEVHEPVAVVPAPEPTVAPMIRPAPASLTAGKITVTPRKVVVNGIEYAADGLTIEWKER